MLNHSLQQPSESGCRCSAEPMLAELLRDPMTLALMAADRVDHGDLARMLAGAQQKLAAARSH